MPGFFWAKSCLKITKIKNNDYCKPNLSLKNELQKNPFDSKEQMCYSRPAIL